jgi:hypothetical protein
VAGWYQLDWFGSDWFSGDWNGPDEGGSAGEIQASLTGSGSLSATLEGVYIPTPPSGGDLGGAGWGHHYHREQMYRQRVRAAKKARSKDEEKVLMAVITAFLEEDGVWET